MAASMYNFESQMADLSNKYAQDKATNEYARFLSQERFSRNKANRVRGFQRGHQNAAIGFNRGMGSGIQSGIFKQKMGDYYGDFNRGMAEADAENTAQLGQFDQQNAQQLSAYQNAILMLQEQMARQRAGEDPFATYSSVYGK